MSGGLSRLLLAASLWLTVVPDSNAEDVAGTSTSSPDRRPAELDRKRPSRIDAQIGDADESGSDRQPERGAPSPGDGGVLDAVLPMDAGPRPNVEESEREGGASPPSPQRGPARSPRGPPREPSTVDPSAAPHPATRSDTPDWADGGTPGDDARPNQTERTSVTERSEPTQAAGRTERTLAPDRGEPPQPRERSEPTQAAGRTERTLAPDRGELPQPTERSGPTGPTGRTDRGEPTERTFLPLDWAPGRTWLLVAVFASLLAVYLVEIVRGRAARGSGVRRVLALLAYGLRLAAVAATVGLVLSLAPEAAPVVGWGLLALLVLMILAARDLLRDVVAWLVIGFERRIRPGAWLSGRAIAGQVVRIGLRSTTVVDDVGRRLAVPNRKFLEDTFVASSARWPERTIEVRVDASMPSGLLRTAMRDAVLACPWVPAGTRPTIAQDTVDPSRWTIRTALLAPHFGPTLDGEMLDRIREMIEAQSTFEDSSDP